MTTLTPLLISSSLAAATAEPDVKPCADEGGDVLADNAFIRPALQGSSFITTQFGIIEGLALTKLDSVVAGSLGQRDFTVASFQQTLDLGIKFTPWFGLNLNTHVAVAGGTDLPTLVAKTLAAEAAGDGDLAVRVLHLPQTGTQLTLRGGGGVSKGEQVSLQPLIDQTLDRSGVSLEAALQGHFVDLIMLPTLEGNIAGGAYLAQAFNRMFSLQASVRGVFVWRRESPFNLASETRIDQDSNAGRAELGAALGCDFSQYFPIALLGEYLFTIGHRTGMTVLNSDIHSHRAALGIYYSGRRHLQLGLTAVALLHAEPVIGIGESGERLPSAKVWGGYGQLTLRYLW